MSDKTFDINGDIPRIMGRPVYYRLDADHNVIPTGRRGTIEVFEGDFEANRRVDQTRVGDTDVSTVFLGMDHNFDLDGPPIVFETMIFGGKYDNHQWRYATWDEAKAGHDAIVKALQDGTELPA